MNLVERPRRLRKNPVIRGMMRETRMSADTLIYPLFVMEGENRKEEIVSMPGQYRYSIDRLSEELDKISDAGVQSLLLFGIPAHKDACGSSAWDCEGIITNYPDVPMKYFKARNND